MQGREGVVNYTIDAGIAALAIPAGQYRVDFRVYLEDNRTVISVQLFCILKATGPVDVSFRK